MNRILIILTLILGLYACVSAQQNCKTIAQGNAEMQVCYYTTGEKSTEISYLKSNDHWKSLKAYDKAGKEIYSREYGQRYGSSGVTLKYYPGGGVSSAHYTMQPDGGIQHIDITTYFTTDGEVDHEDDNSIGDNGSMHGPATTTTKGPSQMPHVTPKVTPKPNECAPVPASTTLHLINYTSERLHVRAQYSAISAGPIYNDIDPSDTVKLGIYYGGTSVDPLSQYKIEVETRPKYDYVYKLTHIPGSDPRDQYIMVTCHKIRR